MAIEDTGGGGEAWLRKLGRCMATGDVSVLMRIVTRTARWSRPLCVGCNSRVGGVLRPFRRCEEPELGEVEIAENVGNERAERDAWYGRLNHAERPR